MKLLKMCRYMYLFCVAIISLCLLQSCRNDDEELGGGSQEELEKIPYTSYVKLVPRSSKDEVKYLKIKNAKFYGEIQSNANIKCLMLEMENGAFFKLEYPMYQYHTIEDVCFDAGTYDYWSWVMHSGYYDYDVIDNFAYIGYVPKSQINEHSGEFTISYSGKQMFLDLKGEYYVYGIDDRTYKEIILHYEGGYVKGPITYQN